jgi:hypothetical protein
MSDVVGKIIARRLVKRAIALGYTVSVNDGEAFTVIRSRNESDIVDALETTDSDMLVFRWPDGTRVGWVYLVWGNAEDIISDCSDNADSEALTSNL